MNRQAAKVAEHSMLLAAWRLVLFPSDPDRAPLAASAFPTVADLTATIAERSRPTAISPTADQAAIDAMG